MTDDLVIRGFLPGSNNGLNGWSAAADRVWPGCATSLLARGGATTRGRGPPRPPRCPVAVRS